MAGPNPKSQKTSARQHPVSPQPVVSEGLFVDIHPVTMWTLYTLQRFFLSKNCIHATYICTYMYAHTCFFTSTWNTKTCTYTTCTYAYVYIHMSYTYTYRHRYIDTCACMQHTYMIYVHLNFCPYIYLYMHINTNTYRYTPMHTPIHLVEVKTHVV